VAGTRTEVRDYFLDVQNTILPGSQNLRVHYAATPQEYFEQFSRVLRETDILWTKPSELSFYCALGIPIIMTPPIGSQERFNRQWLFEMQAGIKQEPPEYTNEWLFDRLHDGLFAEMAWSGFLKARKLGTYKIIEVLREGKMTRDSSPVMR
jgi:UDP-N-acetylglucosamine:LPS N-acetylglucosamine transferase